VCLSRVLERDPKTMRRWTALGLPALVVVVLIQTGWIFGIEHFKRWREDRHPLARRGSPNILLIVLDTVRADRLSLYGYQRPTTPHLERLAQRGIRFDQARATAPWTLPSHASMFTGRLPHELDTQWMCPLRGEELTLAEFLGSQGYTTAGFVGNTACCSYDSGLDRGFTYYRDYALNFLSAIRTVHLIDVALKALARVGSSCQMHWETRSLLAYGDRKAASNINREFLGWLSQRREPSRPFFAFLNYLDAHGPYVLPPGAQYRFGSVPRSEQDFLFLIDGWLRIDKLRIPEQARTLLRDSYDNCLAYLDEQLGVLIDELSRRGVLEHTWIVVTADHGEELGEHELFNHGESLYQPEIHVPLVIVPPPKKQSSGVVAQFVSLRDIPATVADFVGSGTPSPFPGRSLLKLEGDLTRTTTASRTPTAVVSELSSPNPGDPNQGRSPARWGPLFSLAEGDYVYIRNESNGREQLFNARDDPLEFHNLARGETMHPILRRFRELIGEVKADASTRRGLNNQNKLIENDVFHTASRP
jgi:arylsulfatase A-like enzyme